MALISQVARRQAEFARAVVSRLVDSNSRQPVVKYFGHFRAEQKDVLTALEGIVYTHWDGSSESPPRARPVDAVPDPTLELLCWNQGVASFPDSILQKFPESSAAFAQVAEMKKKLLAEFPEAAQTSGMQSGGASRSSVKRAAGRPDFNIEGGRCPLDFTREIDLQHIPVGSFDVQRTAFVR